MAAPRPVDPELTLAGHLRIAIRTAGRSNYAIAKDAGLAVNVVTRFVTGERDLTLASASAIAAALGLHLVAVAPRGRGRPRKSPALPAEDVENDG